MRTRTGLTVLALGAMGLALPVVGPLGGTTPAIAKEACETWHAQMQDDEGGPVMTATACSGADKSSTLDLQCAGGAYLRYQLGDKPGIEPAENTSSKFTLAIGSYSAVKTLQLEEMDGAFTFTMAKSDPLLAHLRSGAELKITDNSGRFTPHGFLLAGARGAIDKVLASCPKG